MLSLVGIYQVSTGNTEDGIINIVIGSSLSASVIPFDYNKAPWWQKMIVIIYALILFVAMAYMIIAPLVQ